MPKFHPTPIIQDCWSSIGDITFYHRNGQCFWKRKPKHHKNEKLCIFTCFSEADWNDFAEHVNDGSALFNRNGSSTLTDCCYDRSKSYGSIATHDVLGGSNADTFVAILT